MKRQNESDSGSDWEQERKHQNESDSDSDWEQERKKSRKKKSKPSGKNSLLKLPFDVVVAHILPKLFFLDIYSLRMTCSKMRSCIPAISPLSLRYWNLSPQHRILSKSPPEKWSRAMHLAYCEANHICGCEVCGIPRVRKVYWPFLLRMCQDCRNQMSISEYHAAKDFNVPKAKFSGLPYTTSTFWNRYSGSLVAKFFLKTDVFEIVLAHHGLGNDDKRLSMDRELELISAINEKMDQDRAEEKEKKRLERKRVREEKALKKFLLKQNEKEKKRLERERVREEKAAEKFRLKQADKERKRVEKERVKADSAVN
ncbi:MAG: hypothetical protein SGCHY_003457 [Lobulomycetales sp.]